MEINVNDGNHLIEGVDTDMPLLWAIRDFLKLKGTKFGCGAALCGACCVSGGVTGVQFLDADKGSTLRAD